MRYFPRDFTITFQANYPEFPDSCLLVAFCFRVNVPNVLIDGSNILVEQLRHLSLRQPDSFIDQPHIDASLAVLALIQQ